MSILYYFIDEETRKLRPEAAHKVVAQKDHNADVIRVGIPETMSTVDLETSAVRCMYQRPKETEVRSKTATYYDTSGGYLWYDWTLQEGDTVKAGKINFSVCLQHIEGGLLTVDWNTTIGEIFVKTSYHSDDSDEADETITPTVAERVAVLETMIQRVASGAPIVVSSASAMTDTDQIYVLKTDGKWYYYNGSAWVAGGDYGAVSTDPTLTQPGVPADAHAVGGKINGLKSALTTANIWHYAEFGAFNGVRLVDATTRARVVCSDLFRYKKYTFHYPSTIKFAALYKNVGGTWSGVAGITNDSYTAENNVEQFIVIFSNKNDTSADITPTELANIYISPIDTEIEGIHSDISDIETDIDNIKMSVDNVDGKTQSTVKRAIPVVHGGFSVKNNQMVEVENNIRAKTPVCDTSEYGQHVILSLPSTIKINALYEYSNSTWSAIVPGTNTEFDFGATCTKFRFSFVNKNDSTSVITDNELANIKVVPTYPEYFENLIPELDSWYYGKKYAALGDSITYGYIPRNYEGYPGQLDSYAKLSAEKLGMTFVNYGISGNTLAAATGIRNPMSERYTQMPDDADLITVMGGTNDIRLNVPLGTMADRTNSTYYGALHVLLGGLYKKYFIDQGMTIGKNKKIVVLTPIKLLQNGSSATGEGALVDFSGYCNAVKEVAEFYSFPILDMQNLSNINPHLNRTIHGWEEGYTGYYNPYITDGTHPTQEGAEIMANVLVGFLKSIV